ncbi:ATP-binding protein [Sphaerisporangium album]|uniref:ATP-binding protein n=1 Tax=Sphaerisporangium album TaxID=509200 RepID=A0A367FF46_9ACTN|nr:ATP-binding protein [Sphaerisporangium album]RCG29006.1 ATP-binding protein [Sphaerisporangium album]
MTAPIHDRRPQSIGVLAERCLANVADRSLRSVTSDADQQRREFELERRRDLVQRTRDRIPLRYRDAAITHAEIAAWTDALISATNAVPGRGLARGGSLFLLGATGRGKTFEAYGVIRAVAEAGIAAHWAALTEGDLFARLRPRPGVDSEAEFERVAQAELLVLDDLGSAKASDWTVNEVVFRLVNYRYEHMAPTVFVSNLELDEIKERLGDRITGRLNEMAQRVVFDGNDRRRQGGVASPPLTFMVPPRPVRAPGNWAPYYEEVAPG